MPSKRARLAGVTAVVAVGAPVVARRRWAANADPTDGGPLDLPAGREVTVATADGGQLVAWVMGAEDGPVVVCAHGWTADRRIWAATARRLVASGHRVVVYDERGHGGSRAGHAGLAISALGDDVAAILERLDVHDVVLAGHSMGGMAVQAFAIEHKDMLAERVRALVLVSTAGGEMTLPGRIGDWAAEVVGTDLTTRMVSSRTIGPFLMRGAFGARPSQAALAATATSFAGAAPSTRRDFLHAIAAMDLTPYLPAVAAATVVVSGTRDTMVPHKRSRRIAELIPGARFVAIRGAGHQLVFEVPDRLAAIVADLSSAGP